MIENIKLQYCIPIYNIENIENIHNSTIQFVINDQLFLETLLMEIRGKTISFSSYKTKQNKNHESNLTKKIDILQKSLTETNSDQLRELQNELENVRESKLKGSLIRSRAKWMEDGEKPTKYFCSLESNHYTNKSIPFIELENGAKLTEQNDILKEAVSFYKTLYNKNDNEIKYDINADLCNINIPKLNKVQSDSLEGLLSIEEVSITLKNMKHDKSPGSDGFTAEFFKVFWSKLGHFIVRSLNYAFITNSLSITQKHGIITCIPKENKPRCYLKNLRPLTLLNVVYKLASGSISNRLKTVLDILISKDQTGFIKGRFIGENTRLLYDILKYAEDNNLPGLLMTIDFEKAFDTLSFQFIETTISFFNFGPMFQKWIFMFLYNTMASIQINGFLSDTFCIERGCRQGDPISAYIFIICAEILAIKIRESKEIKGITINDLQYKISQFADDTSLFLDGSESSLNSTLDMLHEFSLYSGLNINYEKTNLIWIGSMKYSTRSIKTKYKLTWGATTFKVLGIMFDINLDKMVMTNFENKIESIKRSISHWNRRNITPLGKITIVKSLFLPLLTHLFVSLPTPSVDTMKTINQYFYDFIWAGPSKIKKTVIVKDYNEGGLNMVDICSFENYMKITWLKRIVSGEGNCYSLAKSLIDFKILFNTGKMYAEKICLHLKNKFWLDVLKNYILYIEKLPILNCDDILDMPLFYNHNFKISNSFIYIKCLYERGIRFVRDIMIERNCFISKESLDTQLGTNVNFLLYQGLINVIKKYIDNFEDLPNFDKNTKGPILPTYIKKY